MPEREKKRRFFDLFGFDEEDFLFGQEPIEGGSGYSMSVTYDNSGKPVVQVKTHGDVDVAESRRDRKQQYPGARIKGLDRKPSIKIVGAGEQGKRRKNQRKARLRKRKSL